MKEQKSPRRNGRTKTGDRAERFAARYLERRGLRLLDRNWHCRWGELDLLFLDRNGLVCVEVKWRRSGSMIPANSCISETKLERLWRSAQTWLQEHDPQGHLEARIDLLAITGPLCDENTEWLYNLQPQRTNFDG